MAKNPEVAELSQRAQLTPHARRMQQLYRWQALVFDLTRLPILLGRRWLWDLVPAGARVLEVGCVV